jgi:hypothetical protein
MSDLYEAVLNAKSMESFQQLLAEFTENYWIDSVHNGHTLLSAALLVKKTEFVPLLLEHGSDPRFVNRIHLDALQMIIYHGDALFDVLKVLFKSSRYYMGLSVVCSDFYKTSRRYSPPCHLCCAYVEAVRLEQRNPVPVMNRLGALLAPRQYVLSLPDKQKNELAKEVRRAFEVYGALRSVFFNASSSASRLPPVIGSVVAAFLVHPAAEMAVLRELRQLF